MPGKVYLRIISIDLCCVCIGYLNFYKSHPLSTQNEVNKMSCYVYSLRFFSPFFFHIQPKIVFSLSFEDSGKISFMTITCLSQDDNKTERESEGKNIHFSALFFRNDKEQRREKKEVKIKNIFFLSSHAFLIDLVS